MDLSTMKAKIDEMKYLSITEFQSDFNLMIANCLAYNSKDTIFYRAGLRMKEQGGVIIRSAQREAQEAGIERGATASKGQVVERTPEPAVEEQAAEVEETAPGTVEAELAALQAAADTMVSIF